MEAQEIKTYKPFRTIKESEKYFHKKCKIQNDEGVFISARLDGKSLMFSFLIPNKGEIEYSAMSAFYLVKIDNHPFGKEIS